MNDIREKEIHLIEKSIKAIHFCLESLKVYDIDGAVSMYNTLLIGFDSLQKNYESYEGKNKKIPQQLSLIKGIHKRIIKSFESGNLEKLNEDVEGTILNEYKKLESLAKEMKEYENLNINTEAKQFILFRNSKYLENVDIEKIKPIQSYWEKHYGQKIDPSIHLVYKEITGNFDVRVV
ncbi:hypothetical protein B4N84_17455, partial [Flavobacterium sp. IR1]